MAAADALFAVQGVDGTTNTEIASKAGCSIGSLYRYFPDKEALVSEYLDRYMAALAANQKPLPEEVTLENLDDVVCDLLDRSATTRSMFVGYDQVRLWHYSDGTPASKTLRDSEWQLATELLSAPAFGFTSDVAERMADLVVDGTWPLISSLQTDDPKTRAVILDEITFWITSYVRARAAQNLDPTM